MCFGLCFVRHCCLWQAVLYIYENCLFLITLQEKIDTVTVGVENEWEEERIKIKTEVDIIQLVRIIKTEQEVSVLCCVLCGSVLFTGVRACMCVSACACVLYIVFSYALFSYLHITSHAGYTCMICCV